MKPLFMCMVALALTVRANSFGAPQSVTTVSDNAFVGLWEGKINDLPGINVSIQEANGKISGNIVFYFQERSKPSGQWHVAGESSAALLAPQVDGKTLVFEVQHHRCHDCVELGPNVKFRMTLLGANEAQLWNLSERIDADTGLRLVRQSAADAPSAAQKLEMQKR